MQKRLIILFLFAINLSVFAQDNAVQTKSQNFFDSLNERSNKQWLTDSLSVLAWGDSVRMEVSNNAEFEVNQINYKIDSLNSLQLPTGNLPHKIDSINQRKDQLLNTVNGKQQELLGGTKKKLNDWQTNLKNKLGLNMTDINAATTDMGGKPVGDLNLPIDQLNLSAEDLKIPGLEAHNFQNLELPTDLKGFNQSLPFSKIDGLQEFQGKITDVTGQVPSLEGIKNNPDKILESGATNISQVGDVKKVLSTNALDQSEYGNLLKNVNDEEAMKKMVTNQFQKEALNHFAGKDQVLQSAMDQVSKYKKSYSNVNSLSEIKKLSRNTLKGRPFLERFVPGVALQLHVKNYLNLDVNPFAAYRITGKFSAGLGWNQRWAMDWDTKSWVSGGRAFGPRVFTEFKLKRGFAIRLEEEAMNTYVPPYSLPPGEGKRTWLFTTMTGLKKEYRFIKNVRGFTLVQFDLIKILVPNHQSPYGNVVNARLGFEFPMKKKVKKSSNFETENFK